MLSTLVKEHQVKQTKLKVVNDQNKKAALTATESVSNLMTDNLSDRVGEVFATQKRLDKEVKGLQTNSAHFVKQTAQWMDMIKTFNNGLKEVGDFQNWAKTVEWDMRNIASALDYVTRSDIRDPSAAAASSNFPAAAPATPK